MLKTVNLSNFTVFEDVEIGFSPGINVFIGENSTGKTHLAKLGYMLERTSYRFGREDENKKTKASIQKNIVDSLEGVFRPDSVGRLVKRPSKQRRARVRADFAGIGQKGGIDFEFNFNTKSEVTLNHSPEQFIGERPIYFPTREVLSLAEGGFVGLYDSTEIPFDQTYYDLAVAFDEPPKRGRRPEDDADLFKPLTRAMQGKIIKEGKRFFFKKFSGGEKKGNKVEIPLLAEGYRKVGSLAYLISNGVIAQHNTLFWDEPEANLNPALIRSMAHFLSDLARSGMQIVIATHSYFLMKELELSYKQDSGNLGLRYFGLSSTDGKVVPTVAGTLSELEKIVSLEEELSQYDREIQLKFGRDV